MKSNQYTVVINIEKALLGITYVEISRISFFFSFLLWFLLLLYTEHNDFYYVALLVYEK